ncbi:MAG: IS200/IS605 family transposase [Kiritimatiellae bacterium]|nr:IS200/IS605 family transposase [Kiritimatiellia bacterium]
MLKVPHSLSSLSVRSQYKVYLRWHTHRLRQLPALAALRLPQVAALADPYGIHVLEFEATKTEVLVLVGLDPAETVSACAGKLKGRISKHLSQSMGLATPENLLGKGYFACTGGQSTTEMVRSYLDKQSEHHGYAHRVRPPVYVQEFTRPRDADPICRAVHAWTILQFHIVLATWRRKGVFDSQSGPVVTKKWQNMQTEHGFRLLKVSFVPDHVHVGVRLHPSKSPGDVAVVLMNSAQDVMHEQFPEELIRAGVQRVWQNSAYIGSYGDITSGKIRGYVKKWSAQQA